MEHKDSEILRRTLIPPKNYGELSLGDLLLELHQENRAIAHYQPPLNAVLPDLKRFHSDRHVSA
jgi:hypothetical protein